MISIIHYMKFDCYLCTVRCILYGVIFDDFAVKAKYSDRKRENMRKFKTIKSDPGKAKILESFENSFPARDYLIIHKTSEFTSVCPKTGQPDFGTITISYIANKTCVELKSLKFYLQSFRNEGIFYENVVNRILEDISGILKPKWMEVKGEFSLRGGLTSTVIAEFGKKK